MTLRTEHELIHLTVETLMELRAKARFSGTEEDYRAARDVIKVALVKAVELKKPRSKKVLCWEVRSPNLPF